MKIIYVASSIIPSRAANSVHVFRMVNAFKKLGHKVSLVVPNRKNEQEKNVDNVFDYYGVKPFPLYYFPWGQFPGSKLLYGFFLATWLQFKKKDLVYCRDFYPAVFTALLGSPVVMEFHRPPKWDQGLKKILIKSFYRSKNLKSIVVISEALKQIFVNEGFREEQLIVAHDGSDPLPQGINHYPLEGEIKAGYVGHLYKGRGIENIVYLAQNNPSIHFHIAGGNDNDICKWKALVSGVNNIHFHGFISPSQTVAFRLSCDILLAPYQRELAISGNNINTALYMSPLKIFEYMATGRPIICSDIPVLREILDESNSMLVPPGDFCKWDKALKNMVTDYDKSRKLGEKARYDFEKKYTWYKRALHVLNQVSQV